ncbi:MAG TPA: ABC transporter ATP-binding protein [Actinobacteria bacterium]|nr:ABC transporter ATP-binding protein [Actinomycetota bacterium]
MTEENKENSRESKESKVTNSVLSRDVNDYAVCIKNVTKRYRIHYEKNPSLKETIIHLRRTKFIEFLALNDVSFDVRRGETLGIIGPNGSGKSTMLKLISRILKPTKGEVIVNGTISALLELGAGFHPDLTGRENIFINAAILGMKRKDVEKKFSEIVAFSELEKFIDMPVKNYSSGMYMRLGFSVAINVNPDILLVDEVLAVGDQAFQAKCYKVIYDFIKQGKTIIIVSHDLGTIQDLCNRVIFLKNGRIEQMGGPVAVVNSYRKYVENIEIERAHEQQKEERKKIFQTIIENNQKVISGEDIDRLAATNLGNNVINRFGSGDAEITDIRLLDSKGQQIDYCKYGDEVSIEFDAVFKAEVEDPIFGIRIVDFKGNTVYGTNNRLNNIVTGVLKDGDRVKVVFKNTIVLMGGMYYVSPAVGYKDFRTYCDWVNNMLTLNVIKHEKAEGIADLNTSMSILRNN